MLEGEKERIDEAGVGEAQRAGPARAGLRLRCGTRLRGRRVGRRRWAHRPTCRPWSCARPHALSFPHDEQQPTSGSLPRAVRQYHYVCFPTLYTCMLLTRLFRVVTTTTTTTTYAPIPIPSVPPPSSPKDPKLYPLLNATLPRSLREFPLVFPGGSRATFRDGEFGEQSEGSQGESSA